MAITVLLGGILRDRRVALTGTGFDALLAALAGDREQAAERFETIRARLVKFFEWRGCADARERADETIDRVARRLADGGTFTTNDPYTFFYSVATNVLREYWRSPERKAQPLDAVQPARVVVDPISEAAQADARHERERQMDCLSRCLAELPPESRSLMVRYHLDATGGHAGARARLAESLGIPLNALRIRAFRIRQALERCVVKCQAGIGIK